jgi:hypothetical protein
MAGRMLQRDTAGNFQVVNPPRSPVSWSEQRRDRILSENAYRFENVQSVSIHGNDRISSIHARPVYTPVYIPQPSAEVSLGFGTGLTYMGGEKLTPEDFRDALKAEMEKCDGNA